MNALQPCEIATRGNKSPRMRAMKINARARSFEYACASVARNISANDSVVVQVQPDSITGGRVPKRRSR